MSKSKIKPKANSSNIKVVARFRPLIQIELEMSEANPEVYKFTDATTVEVPQGEAEETFTFDRVFPPQASQEEVFEFIGMPTIQDVMSGYNGTIFAYGQTGSGKTHTMMGVDVWDEDSCGIIPRASSQVFATVAKSHEVEFTFKCSMLEIYKETLRDLLGDGPKLQIKECPRKGIYVAGLTECYLVSEEEMVELLELGERHRTVASTKMNKASSRSHQLFMLEVSQKLPNDSEKKGILNLIDLAGSEKVTSSGVTGNKLEEAKKINFSLSALGNVIHALITKTDHIPYRDSKLTRLLQESLGGNYKTSLIVNCSPHPRNLEETLSTLKFAQRAKTIKNKAKQNIKQSPEAYIRHIEALKKELMAAKQEIAVLKKTDSLGCLSPLARRSPAQSLFLSTDTESKVDLHSPLLDESISFLQERVKGVFKEEPRSLDQLVEEILILSKDKEELQVKNFELEKELQEERKKRIKAEQKTIELLSKEKETFQFSQTESLVFELQKENSSLKEQVSILEHHVKVMSDKFSVAITKVREGEDIEDWEFHEGHNDTVVESSEMPVYTENSPLRVDRRSVYGVDLPVSLETLEIQDAYTLWLKESLEEHSSISPEVSTYLLRRQVLQAGLINCELIRSYHEVLWKYNLLKEKFNFKVIQVDFQKQKIKTLEEILDNMHHSYHRILDLVERSGSFLEKTSELGGKLRRPVKKSPVRLKKRMNTVISHRSRFDELTPCTNPPSSFVETHEDPFKLRTLESNLLIQSMYNKEIKKEQELLKQEKETYKSLLDKYEKEATKAYLQEKERWKSHLEDLKTSSEKELMRKQSEINRLHEVLGSWINTYLELQQKVGIPSSGSQMKGHRRTVSRKFMTKLKDLANKTKSHCSSYSLRNLPVSPFKEKYFKNKSFAIPSTQGDSSPPMSDDDC